MAARDAHVRRLVADGLEDLGAIAVGTTLVAGDPAQLLDPPGAGGWHGAATRPGAWRLLGRPTRDGLAFTELVAIHEDALPHFWDLYDEAQEAAAFLLPSGRVLVVDGARRSDPALLAAAAEPEELPWLLDDGIVLAGIDQHPAHVWQPRGPVVTLVAVALDRAPSHRASADAHSRDRDEPDPGDGAS